MASPRNRHERALENFQMSLGGRKELMEVLEYSDDPDGQRLLAYLTDPQFAKNSIRRACGELGLSIRDLDIIHTRVLVSRAAIQIARIHAERMPALLEDTYGDAMPRIRTCEVCFGEGRIYHQSELRTCPTCSGSGEVRIPSSTEASGLLFEAAGMIRRGSTARPNMVVNNEPPLETTVKYVSRLLREGEGGQG